MGGAPIKAAHAVYTKRGARAWDIKDHSFWSDDEPSRFLVHATTDASNLQYTNEVRKLLRNVKMHRLDVSRPLAFDEALARELEQTQLELRTTRWPCRVPLTGSWSWCHKRWVLRAPPQH